jgi:hypothetical protein
MKVEDGPITTSASVIAAIQLAGRRKSAESSKDENTRGTASMMTCDALAAMVGGHRGHSARTLSRFSQICDGFPRGDWRPAPLWCPGVGAYGEFHEAR